MAPLDHQRHSLGLGVKGVEEANSVSQAADLYEVVPCESHDVRTGEASKGVQVR